MAGIEKHHKSMFRRGGKIILSLHPKPLRQQRGPFASSSFNYIRLVFRNGGEDEVDIHTVSVRNRCPQISHFRVYFVRCPFSVEAINLIVVKKGASS